MKLGGFYPWEHKLGWRCIWSKEELSSPQAVKLPATISGSQYKMKGSFSSESIQKQTTDPSTRDSN
jgi:hypothetical protein